MTTREQDQRYRRFVVARPLFGTTPVCPTESAGVGRRQEPGYSARIDGDHGGSIGPGWEAGSRAVRLPFEESNLDIPHAFAVSS